MSRAFINEDAGAGDAQPRFPLPPREDPSFDGVAARALLHGADLGDTASAEAATGYYWGEPKLRPLVERILLEPGRTAMSGSSSWPSGSFACGPPARALIDTSGVYPYIPVAQSMVYVGVAWRNQ